MKNKYNILENMIADNIRNQQELVQKVNARAREHPIKALALVSPFYIILFLLIRKYYLRRKDICRNQPTKTLKLNCMIDTYNNMIVQLKAGLPKCSSKYKDNPRKATRCERSINKEISKLEQKRENVIIKYNRARDAEKLK